MWKQLYRTHALARANSRTFLSDAYKCMDAWQARLESPVLKRINSTPFYYELEKKFQQHGQVCAVDIDIYANKLNDDQHLDELGDLMHKLRLTPETSNALASTAHAVIRHHLDFGNDNLTNLIHILDDRLSYGIFLDTYTANMTLDRLLKLENYQLAAKVATLLMLQDDFTNDISRTLSLYACYKFLENPEPFEEPVKPQIDDPAALAAIAEAAKEAEKSGKTKRGKKKVEEIRVRVKFLRNEFFDDHFDLVNTQHLVGKTFLTIARYMDGDTAVVNSATLLGHCLYEKYEDGCDFIKSLSSPAEIHTDCVEFVQKQLAKVTDRENDEQFKRFTELVEKLSKSQLKSPDGSLEDVIRLLAKNAVQKNEAAEIEEQKKMYQLWDQIRETKLNEELDRINRFRRLRDIERITAEMAEKEERLWFFENQDKIELEIEKNELIEASRQPTKEVKVKAKDVDAAYVPPEIGAKRN